jgi:tetratricopeptide (TPR) repeat protein
MAYLSQGDNENARRIAEQGVALYRRGAHADKRGLAFALIVLAQAHYFFGERAEAEALLQESIALARAVGDTFGVISALSVLVRLKAVLYGDLDAARGYAEEGLRLAREAGFQYLTNALSYNLGLIAAYRNDAVEARLRFEEAIAAIQERRSHYNVLLAKSDLAHLERRLGNHARALELYRETINMFRDVGQRGAVAHQLECFAFIGIAQNQFDRAVRLLGAAEAWREQAGTPMTPDEQVDYQKQVAVVRAQMDAELFARTWVAGRALTMEEAIEYATEAEPLPQA